MKILITGSEGFVGRAFARYFHGAGHDITRVDIKRGIDARAFFAKDDTKFDLVIHLAAVVGGRATIEGNPLAVATDLAIDSDLFQWALRPKPERIIYYSSRAASPIDLQEYPFAVQLLEPDIASNDISNPAPPHAWATLTC